MEENVMKVFCLGAAGRISRESALDLVQYSDFEKITIGDYNYEEACKVAQWLNDDRVDVVKIDVTKVEEAAEMARALGKRIGEELGIPVYSYEAAAFRPERKNLAVCRSGEYEGLSKRLDTENGRPDFGPCQFTEDVARTGASAVGARDFLLAVNYNLNTTSTRRANAIAFDVREKGRPAREGNPIVGKIKKDENGNTIMIPGTLKGCKAIGWYIDEYGIAQVSMNITDINATPLHKAYEEVCRAASARGVSVTGTEIIGLVPEKVLLDAGEYFLSEATAPAGNCKAGLIDAAVKRMGLDDLRPFIPERKVIEYCMATAGQH